MLSLNNFSLIGTASVASKARMQESPQCMVTWNIKVQIRQTSDLHVYHKVNFIWKLGQLDRRI